MQMLREHILGDCEVKDAEIGMLLSTKNNERFVRENPQYSINKLLVMLDERLRARIKLQTWHHEDEKMYGRKLTEYRNYFGSHQYKGSLVTIYVHFLDSYGAAYYIDMEPVKERIEKGKFDVYDVAALLLIYYRAVQKKPDEEFGQIFIDEAQDFGPVVYYALRTVLPECFFTIMGDVSQNVNYECGMNDWRDMKEKIFCKDTDEFRLLSKSYRNTIEISEFAGKILDRASKGAYKIEPVIRHGEPVQTIQEMTEQCLAQHAAKIIENVLHKGYETVSIICFQADEVQKVEKLMAEYKELEIGSARDSGFTKGVMILTVQQTKGLEFDCVLLWKPDMNGYRENPKLAKQLYVAATRALHELYLMEYTGK